MQANEVYYCEAKIPPVESESSNSSYGREDAAYGICISLGVAQPGSKMFQDCVESELEEMDVFTLKVQRGK